MDDQPHAAEDGQEDPIFSSILAECPELWEVVEQFAETLPHHVSEMQSAYEEGAYDRLQSLAVKLKTAGIGHGYADVSERADAIEKAAHDHLVDDIEQRLSELGQLADQIQAGLKTEEDI